MHCRLGKVCFTTSMFRIPFPSWACMQDDKFKDENNSTTLPLFISVSLKTDELDKKVKTRYIVHFHFLPYIYSTNPSMFLFSSLFSCICITRARKQDEIKENHLLSKRNPIRTILTANKTPKVLTKFALFNKKFYSIWIRNIVFTSQCQALNY